MPQDVADLVARAQGRRPPGLRRAGASHLRRTYTLALRLTGNEEDARDVVQEAYLRAFRGLKRFRGDAQFSTWLYRITANCAATHLGRRAKHRHERARRRRPVVDERPGPRPGALAPRPPTARPAHRGARGPAAQAAGRSSCSATSTTCPTRPSPPSSGSPRPRPRSGSTGPARSSAEHAVPAAVRGGARCGVRTLADDLRGDRRRHGAARRRRSDATSRAACGARPSSSSTASCSGRCGPCAPRCSSPRPACSPTSWPASRTAGERHAIRSILSGRRVAYLGGLAAAAAAGAAGAVIFASRRQLRSPADAARRPSRASIAAGGPAAGGLRQRWGRC